MKKALLVFLVIASCVAVFAEGRVEKIPIKVLILPKFEVGDLAGDFPGEAQYYYEEYVKGGTAYTIKGGFETNELYVKNGVALYVTGMGKVNTSNSLTAILLDDRFDFTNTWIFSTGCAGGATELTVMGDVVIASAVADYDLGHHIDPRQVPPGYSGPMFAHDPSYDSSGYHLINPKVVARAYDLTKNVVLPSTEKTKRVMSEFGAWAAREPKVLIGSVVSGDNYWKGYEGQDIANEILKQYGAPDPFYLTEMEDVALATVAKRFGLLDRFFVIRDSVNMAVPMVGLTVIDVWKDLLDGVEEASLADGNVESADVFKTAMENNFKVGKIVVDAILTGTF
jgi:purine nucleoside permease